MSDYLTNLEQNKVNKVVAVKNAVIELVDQTNTMGYENEVVEGIVAGLQGSHRTLQQSFVRALVKAMKEYGESHTDLRNEAAVALAKKIGELGDENDSHLPFI